MVGARLSRVLPVSASAFSALFSAFLPFVLPVCSASPCDAVSRFFPVSGPSASLPFVLLMPKITRS